MSESEEKAYIRGQRQVWRTLLTQCWKELDLTGTEQDLIRLASELEDARAQLRMLCEDFGDNDWPDDLHLADVVDKHLGRHLHQNYEPLTFFTEGATT